MDDVAGEQEHPLYRRLVQAIADPGHFTPRGDDYTEPIPSWSARGVLAALGWEQVGWFVWEDPEFGDWTTVDLDYEDLHHFPHRPLYAVKDAETARSDVRSGLTESNRTTGGSDG